MGSCFFCMPFQQLKSRRKASKCKKLIKQVTYRLKFLQARKTAIIAQTREDIAKLLQLGCLQRASILVEQLYKDKCRTNAYEVINKICECISSNLSCITGNREMSMDVRIAVASLNFAASRCGELPELNKLRILFRDWYGKEFEASSVNLMPTNLVKSELKSTLFASSITDDMKHELIKDITKDYAVSKCLSRNCQQVYDVNNEERQVLSNERRQNLRDKVFQSDLKLEFISERCLNNHDVYDIHKKQYEILQEDDGPRNGKMPDAGHTSRKASSQMNIMDVWLRKSTKNTQQIHEEDIVYLDDIKEKAPQSYVEFNGYEATVLPLNSNSLRKRTPLCSDIQAYQPLPHEPTRKNSNKHTHLKTSTVEDTKTRIRTQTSSSIDQGYNGEMRLSGHVHPKLPCYEDLEVTFKRLSVKGGR